MAGNQPDHPNFLLGSLSTACSRINDGLHAEASPMRCHVGNNKTSAHFIYPVERISSHLLCLQVLEISSAITHISTSSHDLVPRSPRMYHTQMPSRRTPTTRLSTIMQFSKSQRVAGLGATMR